MATRFLYQLSKEENDIFFKKMGLVEKKESKLPLKFEFRMFLSFLFKASKYKQYTHSIKLYKNTFFYTKLQLETRFDKLKTNFNYKIFENFVLL